MVYEIFIEPDLDYCRHLALHQYQRIPYISNVDLYSFVDVHDNNIRGFTDTPELHLSNDNFAYNLKDKRMISKRTQRGYGLKIEEKSLVRFEYRGYDFHGTKNFPVGATCCYEFILNKKQAYINGKKYYQALIDLQADKIMYQNSQGEVISMCVYLFKSNFKYEQEKYWRLFRGGQAKKRYDGLQ